MAVSAIRDGPLFFPVTAFDADGRVAPDAYRAHLRSRLRPAEGVPGPGAVFACCGTGEFAALGPDEFTTCVAVAVDETAGVIPVIAGTGYGTALAEVYANAAARAGADGLLVLPPYLTHTDQAGLAAHYLRLADASPLDLIIYQRESAIFQPSTVAELAGHPRIVGFKDGHGEGALAYFNGMPTAEMSAQPYRAIGVPGYSSAVYCFAPDIAGAFYHAYSRGDEEAVDALLDGFFRPYVDLRASRPGYAVSLVKAGVRLAGVDVGPVRPPLSEPAPSDVDRLGELLEQGRAVLKALAAGDLA
jgi:5-dehydro-4-deoxyglucarate dehydratase